jgi:hypothetical protein
VREVNELWVAVFGLSEVLEEVFYEGCPGFLRLARFYCVVNGAIAVLDLSMPELGWELLRWCVPVYWCCLSRCLSLVRGVWRRVGNEGVSVELRYLS